MSTFLSEVCLIITEMFEAPGFVQTLGVAVAIFMFAGAYINNRGVGLWTIAVVLGAFIVVEEILRALFLRSINQAYTFRPITLSLMVATTLLVGLIFGGLIDRYVANGFKERIKHLKEVESTIAKDGRLDVSNPHVQEVVAELENLKGVENDH